MIKTHQTVPLLTLLIGRLSTYFGKKSSIVVILDKVKKAILILKRSGTDHWMPNKWAFPGGRVEKDEDHETAAVRETKEETNLDINKRNLYPLSSMKGGRVKLFVTFHHHGNVDLKAASHGYEHSDYHWVTLKELEKFDIVPEVKDIIGELLEGM